MMITFKQEEDERRGKFLIFENEKPAGEMTYVWAGDKKFIIDHTETYEGFNGKGYAKQLVMKGVEYAREINVKIMPLCPYAKALFDKTESIQDVLY